MLSKNDVLFTRIDEKRPALHRILKDLVNQPISVPHNFARPELGAKVWGTDRGFAIVSELGLTLGNYLA